MPNDPVTVRELIAELSKFDPDLKVRWVDINDKSWDVFPDESFVPSDAPDTLIINLIPVVSPACACGDTSPHAHNP